MFQFACFLQKPQNESVKKTNSPKEPQRQTKKNYNRKMSSVFSKSSINRHLQYGLLQAKPVSSRLLRLTEPKDKNKHVRTACMPVVMQ